MIRDEVVLMMTEYVNKMNREMMLNMGGLPEQIDKGIEDMRPELDRVNGEIFDMLKENGVIP